jgi:hypothetical protein
MSAKKYKLPKKPKGNSLSAWESYDKKVGEVKKKNLRIDADKKKLEKIKQKHKS